MVFNSTASYGIPSYWVQVLFRNHTNAGSVLLPYNATAGAGATASNDAVVREGATLAERTGVPVVNSVANASFSVTRDGGAGGQVVVKVVNYGPAARTLALTVLGGGAQPAAGTLYSLTSASLDDENSLDAPTAIAPVASRVATGPASAVLLPAWSVNVLRLDAAA